MRSPLTFSIIPMLFAPRHFVSFLWVFSRFLVFTFATLPSSLVVSPSGRRKPQLLVFLRLNRCCKQGLSYKFFQKHFQQQELQPFIILKICLVSWPLDMIFIWPRVIPLQLTQNEIGKYLKNKFWRDIYHCKIWRGANGGKEVPDWMFKIFDLPKKVITSTQS